MKNKFVVLDCVVVAVVVVHVVRVFVKTIGNTINEATNRPKPSTNTNARDRDEHPRHLLFADFSCT